MSLIPPNDPMLDATPPAKRGRKPGPSTSDLNVKVDRILAILEAGDTTSTAPTSALERIAVALERIAGMPPISAPVQTPEPASLVTPLGSVPSQDPKPVKTKAEPAPEPAPVEAPKPLSTVTAPVEDIRSTAVNFVEKWGRDVLVNILSKYSKSGKLSDLTDVPGFLAALNAYDAKAGV